MLYVVLTHFVTHFDLQCSCTGPADHFMRMDKEVLVTIVLCSSTLEVRWKKRVRSHLPSSKLIESRILPIMSLYFVLK